MVTQTGDGGLGGGNSPMVTTVVGIEEFPEGVTTFVSIAMCRHCLALIRMNLYDGGCRKISGWGFN
jgi:hypothetical protein